MMSIKKGALVPKLCCWWKFFAGIKSVAAVLVVFASLVASELNAETSVPYVKTITLEDPLDAISRTYFGEISAKETVSMGFQVGGRILEFYAPEGEIIPKGRVIAQLDQVPFQIAVDQARLTLEQAERQLARFERLLGSAIAEAQLLDARTEALLADVALRDAEYALEQATLKAPFDALVASRSVANFSTVAAGSEVVRLHDMSELRVDIEVPEVIIQQLGNAPDVVLNAQFPGEENDVPLVFREINAEVSQVGQTFRVTLAVEAPPDRLLFPGASVVVKARVPSAHSGFVLPVTAIGTAPDGSTFVHRLNADASPAIVEKTPVQTPVAISSYQVTFPGVMKS